MLGIKRYGASIESGIAISDYLAGMHTEDRPSIFKPAPAWAMSDAMVRQVVTAKICRTAFVKEMPTDLAGLRLVESCYIKTIEAYARAEGAKESQIHLALMKRFGGPAAYFTALIYHRGRLRRDGVAVAQHFGISPTNLRQQWNRLCEVARQLFPGAEWHQTRHHTWKGKPIVPFESRGRAGRPPVQRPPHKIVLCAVCGEPCPTLKRGIRKYCGKPCHHKAKRKRENEKRARARFCSAQCRTTYKPNKSLTNFAFQFS